MEYRLRWNSMPGAELPIGVKDPCDQIEFEHSGVMQSHVVLLNIDRHTHRILNASLNAAEILGVTSRAVIGDEFGKNYFSNIHILIAFYASVQRIPLQRLVSVRGQTFFAQGVVQEHRILLELESTNHRFDSPLSTNSNPLLSIISEIEQAQELSQLADLLTVKMRRVLKVDRVMVYRFDHLFNSEVISEDRDPRYPNAYLGLRFPARDFPRSARRMLQATALRNTVDQFSDGSKIEPANDPEFGSPLDLTWINGRGAAGACQTFYRNIGIRSTITFPITVAGRLWGMVACHHSHPYRISPALFPIFVCFAKLASNAFERLLLAEVRKADELAKATAKRIEAADSRQQEWIDGLDEYAHLLQSLIDCSAFIVRIAGKISVAGSLDLVTNVIEFADKIAMFANHQFMVTNCLAQDMPEFASIASSVAGVIAVPLKSQEGDIAIWVRREAIRDVVWAGNPQANIGIQDSGQLNLSPRSSFDPWRVTMAGNSTPWTERDLYAVESASKRLELLALSWCGQQASRTKSEFISCMSHEIRTPMTAIIGFAELLAEHISQRNQKEDAIAVDYIDTIQRNSRHLLTLIDDILDLAKIESGKILIENMDVDAEAVAHEVISLMHVRAIQKKVDLKLDYHESVPRSIRTDPFRLRQILNNLVGNAIKFTEHGSVTLAVVQEPSQPERIIFRVRDTGIGIAPEVLTTLFTPFKQADGSTTRRFGGSGLGLWICKRLVALLDGTMDVTSIPGKGSCFSLSLKLEQGASKGKLPQTPSSETRPQNLDSGRRSEGAGIPLKDHRIMVVEDGPDNQRLILALLKKAGATVTLFENGKQALQHLAQQAHPFASGGVQVPYDIILCDIHMPECDGLTFVRKVCEIGYHVPVVALTAMAMQADIDGCLQAGFTSHLRKPIDRKSLIETCKRLSEGARASHAVRLTTGVSLSPDKGALSDLCEVDASMVPLLTNRLDR